MRRFAQNEPIGSVGRLGESVGLCHLVLDAAILDIALGDKVIFPVCIVLRERRVPFMFLSGTEKRTEGVAKSPFRFQTVKTEPLLKVLRRLIR